jgi:hypothetical protein
MSPLERRLSVTPRVERQLMPRRRTPRLVESRLVQLADNAAHCQRCRLYRNAAQAVFGECPIEVPLFMVSDHSRAIKKTGGFVGPSGRILGNGNRAHLSRVPSGDIDRWYPDRSFAQPGSALLRPAPMTPTARRALCHSEIDWGKCRLTYIGHRQALEPFSGAAVPFAIAVSPSRTVRPSSVSISVSTKSACASA